MTPEDLPDYAKKIIKINQFQRLLHVLQHGLIFRLMPRATENRYDHCIGTCFKALRMLDALEKNTEDLKIPDFLKKCVAIAALLHDVGHGPLSHQWEYVTDKKFNHEENAGPIIDQIFQSANLTSFIVEEDPQYGNSKELIKSFIKGSNRKCLRDKRFHFLFEIVHNDQCEIDVDKWDYLQRDHSYAAVFLPKEVNVDMNFDDVFLQARASANREHIEYRYLDFKKIYNIFLARQYFHMYFYKMPKAICLDQILKKLIVDNKDDLTINGMNVLAIRSENVDEFLELHDDTIWNEIEKLRTKKPPVEPVVTCLLNGTIEELRHNTDKHESLHTEAIQITPSTKMEIYRVQIEVEYPKNVMKIDRMFFYGNESDKPEFPMEEGIYTSINYFQLKNQEADTT